MNRSLVFFLLLSAQLLAVSEIQIKAVFLEKFTHLIEWPESSREEFNICVLNDTRFAETLNEVYAEKRFKEKPVTITSLSVPSETKNCQVLFIGGDTANVSEITAKPLSSALLTISDNKAFITEKVMITIFLRDKRLNYIINNKAAQDAGIKISYLLLKSAQEVIQ